MASSSVTVSNCVASASVGVHIDIDVFCAKTGATISMYARSCAANLILTEPSARALVYRNGKLIVTGADTEEAVCRAMERTFMVVKDVVPLAGLSCVSVDNIVGTADLGFEINLRVAAEWMGCRVDALRWNFDSEKPERGLRFIPEDFLDGLPSLKYMPPIKVLMFGGGRVIISGAKNRAELDATWEIVRGIAKPFDVAIE
jgi:transcription initiation factor TFIID TATA-box-binding protein